MQFISGTIKFITCFDIKHIKLSNNNRFFECTLITSPNLCSDKINNSHSRRVQNLAHFSLLVQQKRLMKQRVLLVLLVIIGGRHHPHDVLAQLLDEHLLGHIIGVGAPGLGPVCQHRGVSATGPALVTGITDGDLCVDGKPLVGIQLLLVTLTASLGSALL